MARARGPQARRATAPQLARPRPAGRESGGTGGGEQEPAAAGTALRAAAAGRTMSGGRRWRPSATGLVTGAAGDRDRSRCGKNVPAPCGRGSRGAGQQEQDERAGGHPRDRGRRVRGEEAGLVATAATPSAAKTASPARP